MFLFINTAIQGKTEVALFNINGIKIKILSKISSKNLSDKILVLIDKLLKKEKITAIKLKKIFVIKGPGPFTAVRIAIATANTLAYCLKIPVIGVEFKKDKNIQDLITSILNKNRRIGVKKYIKPTENFKVY